MRQSVLDDRIVSRYLPGLFLVVGLSRTVLFLLLGGSSWIALCFFSLVPLGILGFRRPALAAVLSIGPLLGIGSSIAIPRAGPGEVSYPLIAAFIAFGVVVPLTALVAGALFLLTALRDLRRSWLPLFLSVAFVAASFLADHFLIDVNTMRTYKMQFSLDGKKLDIAMPQGEILVYRSVGNGYCFDEIKSQRLRDWLASKQNDEVSVQYQITRDFGRVRGYNVLTVDGIDVRYGNVEGGSGSLGSGTSPECF
jgi:hypothetical protein